MLFCCGWARALGEAVAIPTSRCRDPPRRGAMGGRKVSPVTTHARCEPEAQFSNSPRFVLFIPALFPLKHKFMAMRPPPPPAVRGSGVSRPIGGDIIPKPAQPAELVYNESCTSNTNEEQLLRVWQPACKSRHNFFYARTRFFPTKQCTLAFYLDSFPSSSLEFLLLSARIFAKRDFYQ